jgi:type I restriction enzyme S subunit
MSDASPSTQLPKGWRRVAIKDMADSIQYGLTASAAERKDGPRFLRITDIQDGRVDWSTVPSCDVPKGQIPKYKLSSGDLVFARTGATTGKSFLIGECPEAVFASYLIRVRVSADVDSRYLSAFFRSPDYWRQIEGGKRGIGQPNVNGTVLGEVQFPLAPPGEQRRIVAEIEKQFTRLEAGMAALRRVQANLKRYRAAVLKAACEGKLVPTEAELAKNGNRKSKFETGDALLARILTEQRQNWQGRGKYKEPVAPNTANLPSLPEGWTWATVEQLSTRVQYGSSAKTNEDSTGVPVLRMGNIQEGKFDFDKLKYLPKSHDEFPELLLAKGDLLFNRTNSAELVGKTAVFKDTPQPCSFASYLIRVRFGSDCIPDYVSYFINSVFGRAWIADVVSQQVGQANVNGTKLQALAIPLPPLAEQTRIVAEVERRLSVVEELESVVSANLQRATRLRQSILQRAFTGEL